MSKRESAIEITFEQGYERLKAIAERIDEEEVPVSELCDLFAEGKGLERALSDYLSAQQTRLEEIERGEGIEAFKIVAPAGASRALAEPDAASPAEAADAERAAGDSGELPF